MIITLRPPVLGLSVTSRNPSLMAFLLPPVCAAWMLIVRVRHHDARVDGISFCSSFGLMHSDYYRAVEFLVLRMEGQPCNDGRLTELMLQGHATSVWGLLAP